MAQKSVSGSITELTERAEWSSSLVQHQLASARVAGTLACIDYLQDSDLYRVATEAGVVEGTVLLCVHSTPSQYAAPLASDTWHHAGDRLTKVWTDAVAAGLGDSLLQHTTTLASGVALDLRFVEAFVEEPDDGMLTANNIYELRISNAGVIAALGSWHMSMKCKSTFTPVGTLEVIPASPRQSRVGRLDEMH